MNNETRKKRKIEKVKDILEGKNRDIGRMVDRMDEFIDAAKTLNSTIENFKSVRVENLGDIQFPEKLEVSNLDSISRNAVVENFPEVQKAEILNFPEQKEVEFPDIQKAEITNWPEQKDVEEPSWLRSLFESLLDAFLDKLAVLAKLMWRQTLTVKKDEDDRFRPQWVVVIDPETGQPMRIQSGSKEVHTMVANGGGGEVNLAPLETKIQLLIDGELWQRQAAAGMGYAVTTNNILIANANENNFLLLKNPAGSGKTVRIARIVFGSDENQANKSTFFRIYRDPIITADGTALAINNLKKGGLAGVMTAFKIPTISNKGTLMSAGSYQAPRISEDTELAVMLQPGENMLITIDPTAPNFDHQITVYFSEL